LPPKEYFDFLVREGIIDLDGRVLRLKRFRDAPDGQNGPERGTAAPRKKKD
jgi:hypothetical protein